MNDVNLEYERLVYIFRHVIDITHFEKPSRPNNEFDVTNSTKEVENSQNYIRVINIMTSCKLIFAGWKRLKHTRRSKVEWFKQQKFAMNRQATYMQKKVVSVPEYLTRFSKIVGFRSFQGHSIWKFNVSSNFNFVDKHKCLHLCKKRKIRSSNFISL